MRVPWLLRVVERLQLDEIVEVFHAPVRGFFTRHPRIRRALDGTWLGHPLHAALVSVPIGAFTTGLVLDVATLLGCTWAARGADLAFLFGLVALVPSVLTGITDFGYIEGKARRVTFVHALSAAASTMLLVGSVILRAMGLRGAGIAVSLLGFLILGVGAWLGGELSYHYGAGVGRISEDRRE
ncbi:DUF2231 domain-containing protein [Polyangium jinanense]|uniref:DUF2231 domain-containing protein n=1 Tax=Polyangium jinanense TaxID=2829994 RepID=A0A9X3XCJ3_9BACT|nr:DUF2231 domain-containing protein [Polyangium jinanense]MDC3960579.1 DUF2231 domain-containing protein [Polyangium jinanense]MDC3985441.1 DUF2231 domain-containing protein [Polyangium jinanense]